jgi:hypothetical protein
MKPALHYTVWSIVVAAALPLMSCAPPPDGSPSEIEYHVARIHTGMLPNATQSYQTVHAKRLREIGEDVLPYVVPVMFDDDPSNGSLRSFCAEIVFRNVVCDLFGESEASGERRREFFFRHNNLRLPGGMTKEEFIGNLIRDVKSRPWSKQ